MEEFQADIEGEMPAVLNAGVRSQIWARGLSLGIGVEEDRCTDDLGRERSGGPHGALESGTLELGGVVSGISGPQGSMEPRKLREVVFLDSRK